jgi:hypothetical protein
LFYFTNTEVLVLPTHSGVGGTRQRNLLCSLLDKAWRSFSFVSREFDIKPRVTLVEKILFLQHSAFTVPTNWHTCLVPSFALRSALHCGQGSCHRLHPWRTPFFLYPNFRPTPTSVLPKPYSNSLNFSRRCLTVRTNVPRSCLPQLLSLCHLFHIHLDRCGLWHHIDLASTS